MSPIAQTIAPMKEESVARSVAYVRSQLVKFTDSLIGENLTIAAPFPNARMSKAEYRTAKTRYEMARSLLITRREGVYVDSPVYADAVNTAAIERTLEMVAESAGASFDAYVAKLEKKVGAHDSATVVGALWNCSVLTVTKGDKVENWKTQQIINCSSLGTLFNQWPTRLMK